MPSWELFDRQSNEYKESVLPSCITKRVSLEMGVSLGWERYVGQEGKILSIETFGASGTGAEVIIYLDLRQKMLFKLLKLY